MVAKKMARSLFKPHIALVTVLVPVSAAFLVYTMTKTDSASVPAIASYVLAAYALTVCCVRIPDVVRFLRSFKSENKYARRWLDDTRLRVNVSLGVSLLWNSAYALLQLALGLRHHSFWFCSLAGYYTALALMRFFLVSYTLKHKPGARLRHELSVYRCCGAALLVINLMLALMIFFMVYWNRSFRHREITSIAMAAYTFVSLTRAIINVRKYRRYNSPVYSASKAVSLAAACVSVLTLESTLLSTFGDGTMSPAARRIMLAATGAAVSVFIIGMAIYMMVKGKRRIKLLNRAEDNVNGKQRKGRL